MNKFAEITIKGTSPLLMHRYPMEETGNQSKMTPEEQAEISAYRDGATRELFVPGTALLRCLVGGAAYVKGKGRASLQKTAAACLMIGSDQLGLGTEAYEIDSRPVVVPATKGRIVRHRPKINAWALSFVLEFDSDMMSEADLRAVVDNAGLRVGLLDFRPERKGPFGRFRVDAWKIPALE